MFYGDFVSNFFSLDSILFALFDILTLFQGRLRKTALWNKYIGNFITRTPENNTKINNLFYKDVEIFKNCV
ncbi:hypothetical protein LEP1GSC198_0279 [Leptospira kirschneri str. JB]|nr:hypothetical protein LEP1GSC198_0279 [Leptospira kirschneri str. JB]